MVLLVDSSMIGCSIASGRKVSLLSRMARPPSSEYVLNWSEMCGTWSWASCSSTALKAPHIVVINCLARRWTAPAFHCLEARLALPRRGEWWHPRWRFWKGLISSEAGHRWCVRVGVPGAARSICDDGVVCIAENLKHCEGEKRALLPCAHGGVTSVETMAFLSQYLAIAPSVANASGPRTMETLGLVEAARDAQERLWQKGLSIVERGMP